MMRMLVFTTLLAVVFTTCIVNAIPNSKALARPTRNDKIRGNHAYHAVTSLTPAPETTILASKESDKPSHGHKMSFNTLVINIVADLSPHGMLPLAYGLAKGGPNGLIPSFLLILMFSTMSAYTMASFADLSVQTKSNSIGEIWQKLINVKTDWIVDSSVFALCFGCCVFYSAFIGDIFGALSVATGATGLLAKRWLVLLAITTTIVLPLCLLEDLSGLQFSSIVGVFGIMFTVFFHCLRLYDGSYTAGSKLLASIPKKSLPHWPTPKFSLWTVNRGTLVLANMLCVAFLAHYNSINYFSELENATIRNYSKALALGFGIATAVFATMMIVGYCLFGSAAQPLILNNFPKQDDILAIFARVATGAAIVFAFPLMFAGVKASMMNMFEKFKTSSSSSAKTTTSMAIATNTKSNSSTSSRNHKEKGVQQEKMPAVNVAETIAISTATKTTLITLAVAAITAIAMKCGEEDVSVVLGIVGSVLGCFVAYVLPAYLRLQYYRTRKQVGLANNYCEVVLNHIIIALGTVFGAMGVWITLVDQHSGGHAEL